MLAQLTQVSIYIFLSFSRSFCAPIFSGCLFSTHTDTVFQTAPSSKTSNPTLFSARIKGRKKKKCIFISIYTSNNLAKLRRKNTGAQTFRRANRRRRGTMLSVNTHTQAHISHRQTNTQRDSKHKAQHSQKSILCRNILKCVLQYN